MLGIVARLLLTVLAAISLSVPSYAQGHAQGRGPLVLAAASLQESLTAAADAWSRRGMPSR